MPYKIYIKTNICNTVKTICICMCMRFIRKVKIRYKILNHKLTILHIPAISKHIMITNKK